VDPAGLGATAGSKGVMAGAGGSIGRGDIAGAVPPAAVGKDGAGVAGGNSGGAANAQHAIDNPTTRARPAYDMMDECLTPNVSS